MKKENFEKSGQNSGVGSQVGAERRRREPTERVLRIHELIAGGCYPNCAGLAVDFEVSEKTIRRDMEYMRDHFELPIEYDPVRHGYFYSKPVSRLPGSPSLTEAEFFALLVANKAVAQYHGTPYHQPLQVAFKKLMGQLDGKERYSLENVGEALSFRPFAPEDADIETFQRLSRAMAQGRMIVFDYRKPGEKVVKTRHVHPYHLTCCDNRWYLLGHDLDRREIRTFAVGRMCGVAVTENRFERPADFDANKYLKGSFTVMNGYGDFEVVVEFDSWATDIMRGRRWHASQQVVEVPGGGSHVSMRLSGLEEIERWVLSWGTHATVVAPQLLAEKVARSAREVAARYAAPMESRN